MVKSTNRKHPGYAHSSPVTVITLPDIVVVPRDANQVVLVERIPQQELKELGMAKGWENGVLCHQTVAQQLLDPFRLHVAPVGLHCPQIPHPFGFFIRVSLWIKQWWLKEVKCTLLFSPRVEWFQTHTFHNFMCQAADTWTLQMHKNHNVHGLRLNIRDQYSKNSETMVTMDLSHVKSKGTSNMIQGKMFRHSEIYFHTFHKYCDWS